jgi:hypothetical protein
MMQVVRSVGLKSEGVQLVGKIGVRISDQGG